MPKAELPGFRPGRAPRKLVESRFKEHVADQVKGKILMDSLSQLSDDHRFTAISEPDFKMESVQLPDDGPMVFEFDILVDVSNGRPNFVGPFAQGPKDSRFVYVNSGTYAGQNETCWARRAKISLMQIDKEQILEILNDPTSRLETSFAGTGSDGGPTCASVKGIEWKVTR